METNKPKPILAQPIFLLMALLFLGICERGYCQEQGYALMVQKTPSDGGIATPAAGVHDIGYGEVVILTAIPKAGYRFVYWLGSVSNPTTPETTVLVDSPVIVVAVFERYVVELVTEETQVVYGLGRSGGGTHAGTGFRPRNEGGGGRPRQERTYEPREEDEIPVYDFPVPDSNDNPDEPIPEPGTILLFGFGGTAILAGMRKNRSVL